MDVAKEKESRSVRKKEKTRNHIIQTTMDLIKENGYEATTMELIADTADIAKGTLYKYFPVKEAIISGFIQNSFRDKNPQRLEEIKTLPDLRSRMSFVFGTLLEGVRAQKDIFEIFLIHQMRNMVTFRTNQEHSGITTLAKSILQSGIDSGEIRSDMPIEILLDQFNFTFIAIVKQYYKDETAFEQEKTIQLCVDLFLNGINNHH